MSGPKTSRYVLTVKQHKKLEEQQRIIRETKAAQDRNSNLQYKCKSCLANIDSIVFELEKLSNESGLGKEDLLYLTKKKQELTMELSSVLQTQELQSLQKANKKLDSILIETKELINRGKSSLRKVTSAYKKELTNIILSGLELSFSGLESKRKIKENPFIIKINTAFQKIEEISLSPELSEKFALLQKRAEEITNIDFLGNFYAMQVYPFVHECEFYRDHIDKFEYLLSQYLYLTVEAGEPAKCFVFSGENIRRIEEEIERLNQIVIDQKEQEYISQAVDEAMLEMGYELVGERSVTKKSGKKFRNGLYVLEAGTAVNVTFSDSGQITMELGALDTTDRIPTESEAFELADDMRAFCDDYTKLEKRLIEKGITTKRISVLPPLMEYAQVFNTSDYKLKRPVETYKKEKKKAVARKQLYNEG